MDECIAVSKLEMLMYFFQRSEHMFVAHETVNLFVDTFSSLILSNCSQSPIYCSVYVWPMRYAIQHPCLYGTVDVDKDGYSLYGHIDRSYTQSLKRKYNDTVFSRCLEQAYKVTECLAANKESKMS